MSLITKLSATLAALCVAGAANAATFDFTSLGSGYLGTTVAVLPEGTITSAGTNLYVGAGNISNSICSIQGSTCSADMTVDFNGLASNISFDAGGWGSGDSILVSLFNAANVLLESTTILSNGNFSFASSGVASIFFDDSSSAAGVSYGNWSFDLNTVAPVPLPAGGLLLIGALGALGVARRKRS